MSQEHRASVEATDPYPQTVLAQLASSTNSDNRHVAIDLSKGGRVLSARLPQVGLASHKHLESCRGQEATSQHANQLSRKHGLHREKIIVSSIAGFVPWTLNPHETVSCADTSTLECDVAEVPGLGQSLPSAENLHSSC